MPSKEDFLKANPSVSNEKNSFKPKKRAPYLFQEEVNGNDTDIKILSISTSKIDRWKYKDRPDNEIGDIDSLANEFSTLGQQQPCVVRKKPNGRYELLIGERRWHAAKKAQTKLKVICVELSDSDAALAQIAENDSRKDLSDYAKGISLSKLINSGVIQQKDLTNKLGKTKQYISALLSFSKIPPEIVDAISDMSKVSAKTAERIKQLSSKGEPYINGIIHLADKIREGKVGSKKLSEMLDKRINKESTDTEKFYIKGKHVGTMRLDNNSSPSYHIPKALLSRLYDIGFSKKDIGEMIADVLNNASEGEVPSRGLREGEPP